jgi:hypothetical protein
MPSFHSGVVVEILAERRGLQRVTVESGEGRRARAYALTQLTGTVAVGDRVVVNTTAVELGLGTGGWHVVHWNLERDEWTEPGPGHIMKLRYTSLQVDTGGAEETGEEVPDHLDGCPVVACTLHSQVGLVTATIAHLRPGTRIVYVMTDGAALPLVLSDLVADLVARELLTGTVTAGQAFGGDLEAVTVASAMALGRHRLDAEILVVGMGPGVVGTGTRLGTSSIEAASILDTASALGGTPVLCPRLSDADERHRHRGLSHHTATALDLCRTAVTVPWPAGADAVGLGQHRVVPTEAPPVAEILAEHSLDITTMGRGPDQDPSFFQAAGAVAAHVVALLDSNDDR